MYDRPTYTAAHPPYRHFFLKVSILNCYSSSSVKKISTKLHIFANFHLYGESMYFHLKISDILKRDVISEKGYLRSNRASNFKSAERVTWGRFKIASTITPELYSTQSNY